MIASQKNQVEYLRWLGYSSAIALSVIVTSFGIAWLFTLFV